MTNAFHFAVMNDFIYTGQVQNYHIGFTFAVTTEVVGQSVLMHNCDPVSAHLYGRALTAGLLAAQHLKQGEKYNFVWKYQGEVRTLVVDVKHDNGFRGFISPADLAGRGESTEKLLGDECRLDVVRSNKGRVVTASTAESILQDPVNDLCFFFSYSDQVETDMCVMIGFDHDTEHPVGLCQGLLLQALPDCDLELLERVRKRLSESTARELMSCRDQTDTYFENVLQAIFAGEESAPDLVYSGRPAPYVDCTCDAEKILFVANALPVEDREDILAKQEDLRIHCEFCNKTFSKTAEECAAIWEDA